MAVSETSSPPASTPTGLAAFVPSFPILVGLGAFLRALAGRMQMLNDPDTYLHIAAGRWMLAHHALPTSDPFSSTMPGAHWVPHEWLSEVIVALCYDFTGWSGLVTLTAACFGIAATIFSRWLFGRFEPITGLIASLVGLTLVLPHLLARAHVLALPFLVIWCAGVIRAADERQAPSWKLLPVLVVWANLHGSSMFGVALAGFMGLEALITARSAAERKMLFKGWALFGIGAIAACLATPNFIDGFLVPFRLMDMPTMQAVFIEWEPPDFSHPQLVEYWLLIALFTGFVSGVKVPPMRALLVVILVHEALGHVRHADMLGIVTPLALASSLGPHLAGIVRRGKPSPVARLFARLAEPSGTRAAIAGAAVGLAAAVLSVAIPIERPDSDITANAALAAARSMGLTGPVFNDEGFGGFLIFNGLKPAIDGRMEMYGDDYLKNYLAVQRGEQPDLDEFFDAHDIVWTLLTPSEGAVKTLDALPGWKRVYTDKNAVIHVKVGAPS